MSNSIDRRDFMGAAAVGAAVAWSVGRSAVADDAPSRKVVLGVMGLERGRALATGFAQLPGVEIKYCCDVDENRAKAGAAAVEKAGGKPSKAITDFRQILDDPDVDGLVCAAPNHWHAPATILGCQAGKHVYVEKPCCHNPREGELMVEAARKYKKAVQMGSQRRSGDKAQEAIQRLHEGVIGRVYCARNYYASLRGTIGVGKPAEVPSYLNYELWQGPAPRVPYVDNRVHYNWHWFWHWGNGELGNNGVHTLDLCRWGLGVDFPVRVTSSGGRYRFNDDQETPDTHSVSYEFADNKQITWQGLSCNRHRVPFVTFFGENGTLDLDQSGSYVIYDEKDKEIESVKSGSRGDTEHLLNFVTAIRNDTPLNLNAEIDKGYKSTLLCHLGNIAHRVNRVLKCDPTNGHILDDKEAMNLWSREYASGWEPKV